MASDVPTTPNPSTPSPDDLIKEANKQKDLLDDANLKKLIELSQMVLEEEQEQSLANVQANAQQSSALYITQAIKDQVADALPQAEQTSDDYDDDNSNQQQQSQQQQPTSSTHDDGTLDSNSSAAQPVSATSQSQDQTEQPGAEEQNNQIDLSPAADTATETAVASAVTQSVANDENYNLRTVGGTQKDPQQADQEREEERDENNRRLGL